MSSFYRPFRTALCAFFVAVAVTGCTTGLRGFRSELTSRDPFLDDETESIDEGIELIANNAKETSAAASAALANVREAMDDTLQPLDSIPDLVSPASAADFEDLAAGAEDLSGELLGAVMDESLGQSSSTVDPALFEDLPDQSNVAHASRSDATLDSGGIEQAGFQTQTSLTPAPVVTPPPQRRVNSGLGSATPWGGRKSTANSEVRLSFDDGHTPQSLRPAPRGERDFPINLDELARDRLSTPVYEQSTNDAGISPMAPPETNRRRFDLPGQLDDRIRDTATGAFGAVDQRIRADRKSIRDRFSKLGARFGLGGGEELNEVPVPQPGAPAPASTSSGECLDDLITRTQAKVSDRSYNRLNEQEREEYLRDHVNLRLFYLANNQSERALDAIPGIPSAEQEFWQQMFWSLSQYRNSDAVPDRTERITQTVDQLRTALHRLQENAKLQLSNVSFCKRIDGYGNYERFQSDSFKPGAPVLVYAELDNFKSEPTTSGQYRTLLRSTLQILPKGGVGKPLDSVTLKPVEDVCRNPRRDYFNSYEFTIPNDIEPGRYVLELTIDDQLSGKSARKAVLFTVL